MLSPTSSLELLKTCDTEANVDVNGDAKASAKSSMLMRFPILMPCANANTVHLRSPAMAVLMHIQEHNNLCDASLDAASDN